MECKDLFQIYLIKNTVENKLPFIFSAVHRQLKCLGFCCKDQLPVTHFYCQIKHRPFSLMSVKKRLHLLHSSSLCGVPQGTIIVLAIFCSSCITLDLALKKKSDIFSIPSLTQYFHLNTPEF